MDDYDYLRAEYFKKSYFACDGLWFVKAEERQGFDEALALDEEVWTVLPKLQARKARELLKLGDGVDDLVAALAFKCDVEGYDAVVEPADGGVAVGISSCPWMEILRKSDRLHVAEKMGGIICTVDFAGWAREFLGEVDVELSGQLCGGEGPCRLLLRPKHEKEPADEEGAKDE